MEDWKVMRFGQDPWGILPLAWWFQIAVGKSGFKLLKFLSALLLAHMKYWIYPSSTLYSAETAKILICWISARKLKILQGQNRQSYSKKLWSHNKCTQFFWNTSIFTAFQFPVSIFSPIKIFWMLLMQQIFLFSAI